MQFLGKLILSLALTYSAFELYHSESHILLFNNSFSNSKIPFIKDNLSQFRWLVSLMLLSNLFYFLFSSQKALLVTLIGYSLSVYGLHSDITQFSIFAIVVQSISVIGGMLVLITR